MAAVVSTEPVVAMATTQTSDDRISHAELTDLRAVQRTFVSVLLLDEALMPAES